MGGFDLLTLWSGAGGAPVIQGAFHVGYMYISADEPIDGRALVYAITQIALPPGTAPAFVPPLQYDFKNNTFTQTPVTPTNPLPDLGAGFYGLVMPITNPPWYDGDYKVTITDNTGIVTGGGAVMLGHFFGHIKNADDGLSNID
jgi:hypothetical protein